MRVGVYLSSEIDEKIGGGFTFQESIVSVLKRIETKHQFIIFNKNNLFLKNEVVVNREIKKNIFNLINNIFLQKKEKQYNDDKIVYIDNFDLMWFLSPVYFPVAVPYVMTIWDLQHRMQPYFPEFHDGTWKWSDREKFYNATVPKASLVITGTQAGKDEILRCYAPNPENVRVIPFPVPDYIFNPSKISDQEVLNQFNLQAGYLFYPAQFWPHKNHVNLLRAMALLRDRHKLELEVVFIGSDQGNEQHVRHTVNKLRIRAHFLGFVPADIIPSLYRQAAALVFPTFFGPDNLPPLEAFALGCPVAASNVSGAKEQLGDAALLFDPSKPEEIATAILQLYKNKGLCSKLIAMGYARIKNSSAAEYVKHICTFLDEFENKIICWKQLE